MLTDLYNAFDDYISRYLFIAKLEGHDFQTDTLNLTFDYLSNRKGKVKMNKTFISWKGIQYGVPQGSVFGPLFIQYTSM